MKVAESTCRRRTTRTWPSAKAYSEVMRGRDPLHVGLPVGIEEDELLKRVHGLPGGVYGSVCEAEQLPGHDLIVPIEPLLERRARGGDGPLVVELLVGSLGPPHRLILLGGGCRDQEEPGGEEDEPPHCPSSMSVRRKRTSLLAVMVTVALSGR